MSKNNIIALANISYAFLDSCVLHETVKTCACAKGETRQQSVIDPGRMYPLRLRVILSHHSEKDFLPTMLLDKDSLKI